MTREGWDVRERQGDRSLWQPQGSSSKASPSENERVRRLVVAELEAAVRKQPRNMSSERKWGAARAQYAREWVEVSEKLGLHAPGQDQRTALREGETGPSRRLSAANTRIRQFLEGRNELDWVLAGLESVYCERHGLALPGRAYEVQGRLGV
jgi:hypothetical protein